MKRDEIYAILAEQLVRLAEEAEKPKCERTESLSELTAAMCTLVRLLLEMGPCKYQLGEKGKDNTGNG